MNTPTNTMNDTSTNKTEDWKDYHQMWLDEKEAHHYTKAKLETDLTDANQRAEEFRQIARELEGYTNHEPTCSTWDGSIICDCGLAEALQRLEAAEKEWK